MILLASEALRLTDANIDQKDAFLLNQELYTIQREITKAIRKRRYKIQLAYLITVDATAILLTAGYGVAVNDYGTYISWE